MIQFLLKIVHKDKMDTPTQKTGIAMVCSIVGICLNITLFIVKYILGLMSGSVSVVADAFNNITDALTSFMMMIGVKIASYGKGENHPMGHGRFEWIISSLMAFLVMVIGWNMLTDSFKAIGSSDQVNTNLLMIILMILSICVKVYMYLYNKKYGRLIDSEAMKAVSVDSISDAIATSTVILSILISICFHINVDGYCGIVVSIFIIYNGFKSLCETAGRIMGVAPSKEEMKELQDIILESSLFNQIYELDVEDFGMGKRRVIIRVGYHTNCSIMELQDEIELLRRRIKEYKDVDCLIMTEHSVESARVKALEEKVTQIVKDIEKFSYVDGFHMVEGKNSKSLYFDVAVQLSKEKNEQMITCKIEEAVHNYDPDIQIYPDYRIFHDVRNKPWGSKKRATYYDQFMERRMFPKYYGGSLSKHHQIMKDMLKNIHCEKLLDMACGSGDSVYFLNNDNVYTGLDLSPSFLNLADMKLKKQGFNNYQLICGNACAMEVPDQSFDVVLCNLSLQIIEPSCLLLKEVKRVLKKNGTFIGSTPVTDYGKLKCRDNMELNTSEKLANLLKKNGFQVKLKKKLNGAVCYFTATNTD